MKNLINFDEVSTTPVKKDNIPLSKTKPDLIPVSKTKPDLIPVSKTKPPVSKTHKKIDEIIEKNLIDFTKDPYKNYNQNQSLEKNKK